MIRLRPAGPTRVGLQVRPGQDIELLLADAEGAGVKRRSTMRHCRPEAGDIDIDVFVHERGGPGSTWARAARPGSTVDLIGPKGKLEIRPESRPLFIGDEASLPAVASLTGALDADQTTMVVLEATDEADHLPLRAACPAATPPGEAAGYRRADDRCPASRASSERHWARLSTGRSRAMIELRPHLSRPAIAHEDIFLNGYWNNGKQAG
jgi:NADPH-dependent ferric siderophore reductase